MGSFLPGVEMGAGTLEGTEALKAHMPACAVLTLHTRAPELGQQGTLTQRQIKELTVLLPPQTSTGETDRFPARTMCDLI